MLGRRMQWDEASVAELRLANRHDTSVEIKIADIQADRLTDPNARHRQKPEEAMVSVIVQIARRSCHGRVQESIDLLIAI